MENEFKKDIELCKLVGKLEALVFFLKTEKKNSLDFQTDFDRLVITVDEIKKILLSE